MMHNQFVDRYEYDQNHYFYLARNTKILLPHNGRLTCDKRLYYTDTAKAIICDSSLTKSVQSLVTLQ